MVPRPVTLGLTLCDYVIVEERTKKISLIGSFSGIAVDGFPALAQPFSLFAALTDGIGIGVIDVVVARLDSGEEVYTHRRRQPFLDNLGEVAFHLRVRQLILPAPGQYQITLLIDGEWVAQRRIRVYEREAES